MNSLYVFGNASWDGPVKIGVASDVSARLEAFRHKLPFEPWLLFSLPHDDAFDLEAHVHRALSAHRLNGEWFDGSAFGQAGLEVVIASYGGRAKTRGEPDEYSVQVSEWVRALIADYRSRTGDSSDAALDAIADTYGLRRTFIWSQLYRPAVRVYAADYFATKAAFDRLPNEPTEHAAGAAENKGE